MAIIKFFSDLGQTFTEFTSKDEIVFGEIIRIFHRKGNPLIGFKAREGYQEGRFLMKGEVLFSLTVILDKKIAGAGLLTVKAEVRNKLADPDDMIEMFKTDMQNMIKLGWGGQVKVNHEYNSIFARTTLVKKISSYLSGTGVVDSGKLDADLTEVVDSLEAALRKYKKD